MLESYTPNYADPRVKRRIKRALGFTTACFSADKSRTWSTRYIDKHFGISSNELSNFLRNTLLICTNEHYRSGVSKSYRLNQRGVDFLRSQLKADNNTPITSYPCVLQVPQEGLDWAKEEFKAELNTRVFSYKHKSNRNWHPLQRVRKSIKRVLFHDSGMRYQYDIACCAPRLLLQYSQQIPEKYILVTKKNKTQPELVQGPMDQWLEHINTYLSDKTRVREELAHKLEVSTETAKQIINALFAGARVALNTNSAIYQLLDGDIAKIHYLKQDSFVTGLRADIKTMWTHITPTMPRRTTETKTGQTRLVPISSKDKWHVYFTLEFQVITAIADYLRETNNQFFTEHDGWTCMNEVDQTQLRNFVMNKTGFDIKLDLEIL